MARSEPLIELDEVEVSWTAGGPIALVVHELVVEPGERIVVHGPSGGGKSTLLSLLAGVLVPRRGHARVFGHDLAQLSATRRDRLRGERMGMVFQTFHLLAFLSTRDNIVLPCRLSTERRRRLEPTPLTAAAEHLAARLGIAEVLGKAVGTLSVGQQQRVAAARALLGQPDLLLCDEPTSSLDPEHRDRFLDCLDATIAELGTSLLITSHDPAVAERYPRRLAVRDGVVTEDQR